MSDPYKEMVNEIKRLNPACVSICPRCYKEKPYFDFHPSGGKICSKCYSETNSED